MWYEQQVSSLKMYLRWQLATNFSSATLLAHTTVESPQHHFDLQYNRTKNWKEKKETSTSKSASYSQFVLCLLSHDSIVIRLRLRWPDSHAAIYVVAVASHVACGRIQRQEGYQTRYFIGSAETAWQRSANKFKHATMQHTASEEWKKGGHPCPDSWSCRIQ
jgi:hypothetical protein